MQEVKNKTTCVRGRGNRLWQSPSLHCLLLACSLLYGIEIGHGLPNRDTVWSADANPLSPLITLKRVFLDGWNTGHYSAYPNFHYWVLSLVLVPYMGIQYLLGNLEGLELSGGYPYGLKNFDTIFMHLAILTRLVSVLMAMGTVYFVMRTAKRLFPNQPPVFAGAIFGFSPALVYYVHGETLDIPMLFWLSAAIYCYLSALQTYELRYYVWLAILAAISTATKEYAYAAFVLMPIPLVVTLARMAGGHVSTKSILIATFDRRHFIALGVFILAFILAENLLWNPTGFVNHVRMGLGQEDVRRELISTNFDRTDYLSVSRIVQIGRVMPFVLGWGGAPICLLGTLLLFVRQRQTLIWLAWPMVSYYLFTVVPVLPANSSIERPFMGIGIMAAICGGYFLSSIWQIRSTRMLVQGVCGLLVLGLFVNGLLMTLALKWDTRYQVAQWLDSDTDEPTSVEFYGYRRQAPKQGENWHLVCLNQLQAPSQSDIQIDSQSVLVEDLRLRGSDIVLVAEPYADNFKGAGKLSEKPYFSQCAEFFQLLSSEKAGYRKAAVFRPFCGRLFGMPFHREYIPEITLYKRQRPVE